MQQAQCLFENGYQAGASLGATRSCFFSRDIGLDQLDVPITEVIPEEVIESLHRFMKLITPKRLVQVVRSLMQTRDDPTIVQRQIRATGFQGFRIDGCTLRIK